MNIIILTILGALILLWGAILAIIKWIPDFGKNHLLGFGGYASLVCAVLIFIVVQTSITQQESALDKTRDRLNQELENFRLKLGEVQDRVMTQLQEKAELTESEWKVRGDLQTEREQHARTREVLAQARKELEQTQGRLQQESSTLRAYVDSLNTERALHATARDRLAREEREHKASRQALSEASQSLAAANQRIEGQEAQVTRLKTELAQSRKQTEASLKAASIAEDQIQRTLTLQRSSMETLQASVDSIYKKVLKRPRIPLPEK
jgi:chromosome segregation ATPase